MATFQKGQNVKVNAVIPSGEVQKMRMDDDGNVSYFIQWIDVNGTPQERWFDENELIAG